MNGVLPLSKGKPRECISKVIGFTFDAMEFNTIIFKVKSPTEDPLSLQFLKRVVLVVSADVNIRAAAKHGAELFKSLNN